MRNGIKWSTQCTVIYLNGLFVREKSIPMVIKNRVRMYQVEWCCRSSLKFLLRVTFWYDKWCSIEFFFFFQKSSSKNSINTSELRSIVFKFFLTFHISPICVRITMITNNFSIRLYRVHYINNDEKNEMFWPSLYWKVKILLDARNFLENFKRSSSGLLLILRRHQ